MNKLSKNSIPKLGRKINQLKKKISRNEINGDMEKVEFRKMRIKKIEKYGLNELKSFINFGASPRGSINLANASRCYAFIKRRGYVIPEDVRAVIHDVLRHRIGLTYEAEAENVTSEDIINKIVNQVEVP